MGSVSIVLVSVFNTAANAFYLPGVAPTEYEQGQNVPLKVNKMTSSKEQMPYRFYDLPFCQPGVREAKIENLGEILAGDIIENSPYAIRFLQNKTCEVLCSPRTLSDADRNKFKRKIDQDYRINWIVDNLPAAIEGIYFEETDYEAGFPVGLYVSGHYYISNHVTITLMYHSDPARYQGSRIVGFEVEPSTVRQNSHDEAQAPFGVVTTSCIAGKEGAADGWDLDSEQPLIFTYDVRWAKSDVRWASRWDVYLKSPSGSAIHWFPLLNSVLIMVLLTGVVAIILAKTLNRDIAMYNLVATEEDKAEETGWKLVHGDVFRKPPWTRLLVVSVGSGFQLLGMCVTCLAFALLGLLSPANRGGLLQSMMLVFTFMGALAGYISSRLCKIWNCEETYKSMTIMLAFLYPGIFFAVFFILNLCIWAKGSSGAVPVSTMFVLLVLWFGISVPLVYLGSYFGFKSDPIELPVRTCHHPRQIKEQPWYMHPIVATMTSSILPFGAIFAELNFIMSSVWNHRFYYMFGFLALVLIICLITCAEISIAMTYMQLAREDHQWWWRSFFYSGASGIYVFFFSIWYFAMSLSITDMVPTMLYFGYMFLSSLTFALLTGSFGMVSTFLFVKAIYGSIKID